MMEQTFKELKLEGGLRDVSGLNRLENFDLYTLPQWLKLIFSNFLRIYPIFSN